MSRFSLALGLGTPVDRRISNGAHVLGFGLLDRPENLEREVLLPRWKKVPLLEGSSVGALRLVLPAGR